MYYLPLAPYHGNLLTHWREHRDNHPDEDFWSWAEKEWGATILVNLKEDAGRWRFEREKDAIWFELRWS